MRLGQMLNWQTREPEQFFSQMPLIKSELESYQKSGQTVVLQADNDKRARQIDQTMADFGLNLPIVGEDELVEGRAQIMVGGYASGFSLPTVKLVYLTERELFNKRPQRKNELRPWKTRKDCVIIPNLNLATTLFTSITVLAVLKELRLSK